MGSHLGPSFYVSDQNIGPHNLHIDRNELFGVGLLEQFCDVVVDVCFLHFEGTNLNQVIKPTELR